MLYLIAKILIESYSLLGQADRTVKSVCAISTYVKLVYTKITGKDKSSLLFHQESANTIRQQKN